MKTITNDFPIAKICIGNNNEVKQYFRKQSQLLTEQTVYLKDKTEFKIELFNPTKDKIICKMKFNGNILSRQGLILRPGERIFLERFLDENKKFIFETYDVDLSDDDTKQAIMNNGDIEISFYKEKIYTELFHPNILYKTTSITSPSYQLYPNTIYCSNSVSLTSNNTSINNANYSNTIACDNTNLSLNYKPIKQKSETGRIEKGDKSNQLFVNDNIDYEYYPFHVVHTKILPFSQKLLTDHDIKVKKYCSNCGKKLKYNDKYCSNCGEKV